MVFTIGAFQCHSSIHTRHTFHTLPCVLHTRRTRAPSSAQASGEDSPLLAARPSLSSPPKRPAAPVDPDPPAPQVVDQQAAAQKSNKQPGRNGNGAQPHDRSSTNASSSRPQGADKRQGQQQKPKTPTANKYQNNQNGSSRPKRQKSPTQQAMNQVRAQSGPSNGEALGQSAAAAPARPATKQAPGRQAAPPALPSVAKPPLRRQQTKSLLPLSHHVREGQSKDQPDQSYDRAYQGPSATETVDLADRSASSAPSAALDSLQKPERSQQPAGDVSYAGHLMPSMLAKSRSNTKSPSATSTDQPALAAPPPKPAAAAPAPSPALKPPPMAGPPKRPAMPSQQPFLRQDLYPSRQELPGSRDVTWDMNTSTPSDLPDVPALPPPSPQTAESAASDQQGQSSAEPRAPAEQPILAAKPGLRPPPTRLAVRQSIDPASFDQRQYANSRDSPQNQNGAGSGQRLQGNASTPAANTNGAAAPGAARPGKNKRGKKRGDQDQDEGRGKQKGQHSHICAY